MVELKNIMYKKIKITMVLSILLLSSLFIPSILATAWWDKNWSYKIKITVDETKVDADLTDFPVMVYLNSSRIDWSHVQDDLDDLRFLDSTESTILKAELEKYEVNNKAWIWVKIPTINNAVDTDIYMYYGNTGAVSAWNAENVWESSAVMVQHMYDNPDTSHVMDSTSYSNDGTKKGANEPIETASGKIGSALNFDGGNDYIACGNSVSLNPLTAQTVEMWLKPNVGYGEIYPRLISHNDYIRHYSYINPATGNLVVIFYTSGGVASVDSNSGISVNVWNFIVYSYNGDYIRVYINGVLVKTSSKVSGNIISANSNLLIGNNPSMERTYNGIIDEFRIYNTAKSAEWTKADYNNGADTLLGYSTIKSSVSSLSAGLFIGLFILFMVGVLILALVKRR